MLLYITLNININFLLFLVNQDETIDFKKLLMQENSNAKNERVTVNLPTIVKANSAVHKHSPFTFSDKDINATIKVPSIEVIHFSNTSANS